MDNDRIMSVVFEYRDYALNQGGIKVNLMEVDNIRIYIKALKEISTNIFPSLAVLLPIERLLIITGARRIIDKGLRDGMKANKDYKEIYKDIKKNVELFADLHGQSEVISKHLALTEEN